MNLKKLLKLIKLNESTISMVLGAIVVIVVGSLVIKYFKSGSGQVPTELLNQENAVEGSFKTHEVKEGETLWSIAETYYQDGFKSSEIASENKLSDKNVIEVGQKLIIPEVKNESENSISSATYEVVKGDNLWNIAVRAYGDGYKWVEIASENKLVNPNVIHAGNILVLPR